MFTALGETISERAGVLNIGLEGMMLLGAYLGFVGAHDTGSVWVGFLSGIGAGMIGAVVMIVLCVWLGLDQIVVGIAITLGGEGITSVLQQAQFGSTLPAPRRDADDPDPAPAPAAGAAARACSSSRLLVYLAFAFVGALAWMFRADERRPEPPRRGREARGARRRRRQRRRHPQRGPCSRPVRSPGSAARISRSSPPGAFTPFITQGQGFMAIVIAMLARGRPLWVLLGSFLFGIALSLADSLQLAGYQHLHGLRHHAPVRRRSSSP